MAKFHGVIGYTIAKETAPGVWIEEAIERPYTGDILRVKRNWQQSGGVNPNLTMSETISIIADSFTLDNVNTMRYVKLRDAKWAINGIEVERPRILITIGGLYSGKSAATPG